MADLFSGRPRSRCYSNFNIGWDIPASDALDNTELPFDEELPNSYAGKYILVGITLSNIGFPDSEHSIASLTFSANRVAS